MSAFAGPANWRLRKESNESPSLLLDAGNSSSYSGSGTTWSSLRNSFNYTLVNSPTFVSSGQSSYFDLGNPNTNKYIGGTSISSLNLNVTGFTYEIWVRPGTGTILGEGSNSGASGWDVFLMEIKTNGYAQVGFWIGSGYQLELTAAGTLSTNNWYQIVMTYDNTTLRGYVNGVLGGSGTATKQWGGFFIDIGYPRFHGSNMAYFTGGINRFSIYNRALSATEVQRSFNAYRGRFGI